MIVGGSGKISIYFYVIGGSNSLFSGSGGITTYFGVIGGFNILFGGSVGNSIYLVAAVESAHLLLFRWFQQHKLIITKILPTILHI